MSKLKIYHPNAKGMGSALTLELHPAHDEVAGLVGHWPGLLHIVLLIDYFLAEKHSPLAFNPRSPAARPVFEHVDV